MHWIFQIITIVLLAIGIGFVLKTVDFTSPKKIDALEIISDGKKNIWGVADMQGRRSYMEDTNSILIHDDIQLFGVYDGHANDRVSIYLKNNILTNIYNIYESLNDNTTPKKDIIHNSLFKGFLYTNEEYKKYSKEKWSNWGSGGSTSVVGIIYRGNDNKIHISVANTGDSRGVYCCNNEKVYPMSYDHKPDNIDEKKRIESTGGFVSKSIRGPWRVNGILATSRAFGDFDLSPQVIADPEIIDIEIGYIDNDNNIKIYEEWKEGNLILASDGFWDVFKNQEAVSHVKKLKEQGLTPKEISQKLVSTSYSRLSSDNITLLIVFIDELLSNINK